MALGVKPREKVLFTVRAQRRQLGAGGGGPAAGYLGAGVTGWLALMDDDVCLLVRAVFKPVFAGFTADQKGLADNY